MKTEGFGKEFQSWSHTVEGTAPSGERIKIGDAQGARIKGKQISEDGGIGGFREGSFTETLTTPRVKKCFLISL